MTDTAATGAIRPVPQLALDFIMKAEGCRLTPYLDGAGHPTNGWGNTVGVVMGQPITMARAEADLAANANVAARRLADDVHPAIILKLTDHEYGALISFVFNLGADPTWTIWKILNAGQVAGVPDQMKRFDKARDPKTGQLVVVPGLDHRRLAEVTLWNTPDVDAAIAVLAAAPVAPPPSSYTRAIETPPTPQTIKPLVKQPGFVTQAVTACTALGAAGLPVVQGVSGGVKQVSDAIAPYADGAPWVAKVQGMLLSALAVLAIAAVGFAILTHRAAKQA